MAVFEHDDVAALSGAVTVSPIALDVAAGRGAIAARRSGRLWLDAKVRVQRRAAGVVTAGACLLALAGLRAGPGLQMVALLAGIVLIGFPHGAFDLLVARSFLLARLGRGWWVYFLVGYLGLAGLAWLGWLLSPALLLGGFLAATVLHFGLGDSGEDSRPLARWIAPVVHGGLPILLPIAFHPAEAAPVLAAIGGVAPETMRRFLGGAGWLLAPWALAFVWLEAADRPRPGAQIGRIVTIAGFVILPPLLGFGLYFCLSHSARHVLEVMAWRDGKDFRSASRWAGRIIAPASLVCAAGVAGFALITGGSHVALLAQTFRVIAALTFPHMIVTSWLDRSSPSGCPGRLAWSTEAR